MSSISTSGIFLNNSRLVQLNSQNFQDLQFQLASGRKYSELARYENNAFRLIEFRGEIDARNNYVENIDRTQATVGAYSQSFTHLINLVDQLQELTRAGIEDGQPPGYIRRTTDNVLLDIEATLNAEFGGRYIFGGINYNDPPVADLTNLDAPTEADLELGVDYLFSSHGADFGAVDNVNNYQSIPVFRTNVSNIVETAALTTFDAANSQSYLTTFGAQVINTQASVLNVGFALNVDPAVGTIDNLLTVKNTADNAVRNEEALTIPQIRSTETRTVDYGFNATERGFGELIYGLLNIKASTEDGVTAEGQQTFINRARELADRARDSLRNLEVELGLVNDRLENYKELHQNYGILASTTVTQIQEVDTARAAIELSSLQTLLQASYSSIARQQDLSLVNFLR